MATAADLATLHNGRVTVLVVDELVSHCTANSQCDVISQARSLLQQQDAQAVLVAAL